MMDDTKQISPDVVRDHIIKELDDKVVNLREKVIPKLESDLASYKNLGTPEEINTLIEAYTKLKDELKAYNELGSIEDITELMESYEELVNVVKESCDENNDETDNKDDEIDNGEVSMNVKDTEVKEVKNMAENADPTKELDKLIKDELKEDNFQQVKADPKCEKTKLETTDKEDQVKDKPEEEECSKKECDKKESDSDRKDISEDDLELLARYKELGTPEEIETLIQRYAESKKADAVNQISSELNIDPEIVESTLEKTQSIKDTKEMLEQISESINLRSFKVDKSESVKPVVRSNDDPRIAKLRRIINYNC